MSSVNIYNFKGKAVGTIDLVPEVFEVKTKIISSLANILKTLTSMNI
jgi:ribosomal protein L4